MNIGIWRKNAQLQLAKSGDEDAVWDADWMLCEVFGCSRAELRWQAEKELSESEQSTLDQWLSQRVEGRPLQYILGNTCFMGLMFKCDERALIPRQDTETLVELSLGIIQKKKNPKVLDLCCGTGAIGLSMKHIRRDSDVTLSDISTDALNLAKENAEALGLDVRFVQGDLFEAVAGEKFDLVLSNPPYLTEQDMNELMREVKYEPELALRGGQDGLVFYRRIAEGLDAVLTEKGEAVLEVGMGQHQDVVDLLKAQGFKAKAYKDLCRIERVVHARRK